MIIIGLLLDKSLWTGGINLIINVFNLRSPLMWLCSSHFNVIVSAINVFFYVFQFFSYSNFVL